MTRVASAMAAFVAGQPASNEPGSMHEQLIATPHKADDGSWCCIQRYWYEGGGTYAVSHGLETAEPCEESDVPSMEAVDAVWTEYAQHVAATGADPLHNYMAGEPEWVTDTYIVDVVTDSASGQPRVLRFMDLARDGDAYYAVVSSALVIASGSARIMPNWLRDYLGIVIHSDGAIVLDAFNDLDGLMQAKPPVAGIWRLNDVRVRLLCKVGHWQAPEGAKLALIKREAAVFDLAQREGAAV